jgi:hypothetical protein
MTRLATIFLLIANCQLPIAKAQLMPPTQVDTGWMMADVAATKQQVTIGTMPRFARLTSPAWKPARTCWPIGR